MSLPYEPKVIPNARKLRKEMTKQERHLWYDYLARYPVRFQRQKTILVFVADFYCHRAKLVLELDGSQHYTEEGLAYDAERTQKLEALGLAVVRIPNNEVDYNFHVVCEYIDRIVTERIAFIESNQGERNA